MRAHEARRSDDRDELRRRSGRARESLRRCRARASARDRSRRSVRLGRESRGRRANLQGGRRAGADRRRLARACKSRRSRLCRRRERDHTRHAARRRRAHGAPHHQPFSRASVIAAIDARGSQVATHGWQERTPVDRDALVRRVAQWGVSRIIFTEIRRDGMGEGYDIDALNAVAARPRSR